MRTEKKLPAKSNKKTPAVAQRRGVVGYSKKSALLEEAITHMNTGKYGRSSAALKELLTSDPQNMEARRLFATLHLKLGSLVTARQAFEALANEAIDRQDYWLAESLLREYLAAGPRCVPFLELLAHVYREKGDEMAAVAELGKAVEILRDDPDPEHAQKATEIYRKIRELAPASPVALELAPLFDVQTGEFLLRHNLVALPLPPPVPIGPPCEGSSKGPSESGRPEVSPLDLFVSQFSTSDSLPASNNASTYTFEVSEKIDVSVPLDVPPQLAEGEAPESSPLLAESTAGPQNTTVADPKAGNDGDDGAAMGASAPEVTAESAVISESASDTARDEHHSPEDLNQQEEKNIRAELFAEELPSSETASAKEPFSPMPWDQHADASVQIPGATSVDAVPNPDAGMASTPIALSTDTLNSAAPVSNESDFSTEADPASCENTTSSISAGSTAAVPSPMPWEEVADPSVQIPGAESDAESALVSSEESQESCNGLDTQIQQLSPSADLVQLEKSDSSLVSTDEASPTSLTEEGSIIGSDSISQSVTEISEEDPEASAVASNSAWDTASSFAEMAPSPSSALSTEKPGEVSLSQDHQYPHEVSQANVGNGSDEVQAISTADMASFDESAVLAAGSLSSDHLNGVGEEEDTNKKDRGDTFSIPAMSSEAASDCCSEVVQSPAEDIAEFQVQAASEEATQVDTSSTVSSWPSTSPDGQENREDQPVLSGIVDSNNHSDFGGLELSSMTPVSAIIQPAGSSTPAEPLPEVSSTSDISDQSKEDERISPPSEVSPPLNVAEAVVQGHSPIDGKTTWEKESKEATQVSDDETLSIDSLDEDNSGGQDRSVGDQEEETRPPDIEEIGSTEVDTRPEWMQASESISFFSESAPPAKTREDSELDLVYEDLKPLSLTAASAVDELFPSTETGKRSDAYGSPSRSKQNPAAVVRFHRIRIAISSFIGSCFATTRSLTFLVLMVAISMLATAALAVTGLAIIWMVMEEPPSPRYQSLTITPPRTSLDFRKNGYFLLLGFDAPVGKDPIEAGYERKSGEVDLAAAQVCVGGQETKDSTPSIGASAHVVKGWFRSGDSVVQIKAQSDKIRTLAMQESTALARYQQWLTMPFDDRGYGQMLSPNCPQILFAHRLFILEGFGQDTTIGLDRLERDIQSWRGTLGGSRTLMTKMLALTALQDDATIASGLLSLSELDASALTRLSRMVRPLDQAELSLRWPIQSRFVWEAKTAPVEIKRDKSNDRPWYVSLVAAMPLPIQRRANAYAEYYEETNKAVSEGRFSNLPQVTEFIRTPPTGMMDYLANPIENIVGRDPLPSADPYVMRMIETEAQLRLVGLQAWIRRGPQGGDVLTRLAQAGQAYYDPFTGLPMLVNQHKGLIYSVGRDGKDQEGDRNLDVVVATPTISAVPSELRR